MNLQHAEIQKLTKTFNEYITEKTSQALSVLLSEPIDHKLTMLCDGEENTCDLLIPTDEIKMCAVRLNGKGDIHIELLYTTKLTHAIKIASKLLGSEVTEIDEMGTSALQEVANIMTGSFFNALSENTGFKVDLSTPTFREGELKDLVVAPASDVVSPTSHAIITDSLLWGKETGTEIHMFIIQHPEHARKLILHASENSKKSSYDDSSNTNLIGGENSEIDFLLNGLTDAGESEIDALLKDTIGSSN